MVGNKSVPCLYGAVVLVFPPETSIANLKSNLPDSTKVDTYNDCIEVLYCEEKNLHCWEVDELLTSLFKQCDLRYIKSISANFKGYVLLDISCCCLNGSVPALLFHGENMDIIRKLNASISIDLC